jgi:hypothetical protein
MLCSSSKLSFRALLVDAGWELPNQHRNTLCEIGAWTVNAPLLHRRGDALDALKKANYNAPSTN